MEDAGTQKIRQREPAVFFQDKWQPRSNLTIQYGLRWEAQDQPEIQTPPDEVFFAPFIGDTVTTVAGPQPFPSDGKIPDDETMFQPRLGITWDPRNDGRSVLRLSGGIFSARIPGLSLASTRSTNGSIGQTLFRNSALTPILGPVPAYPGLIPASSDRRPVPARRLRLRQGLPEPAHHRRGLSYEREIATGLGLSLRANYAKTDHITRFVNRNDPLLGSPWSTGLPPGGANGIAMLTTVESTAKSRYTGVTLGLNRRWTGSYQGQLYYTYSRTSRTTTTSAIRSRSATPR